MDVCQCGRAKNPIDYLYGYCYGCKRGIHEPAGPQKSPPPTPRQAAEEPSVRVFRVRLAGR